MVGRWSRQPDSNGLREEDLQQLIWIISVMVVMGCIRPGSEAELYPALPPTERNEQVALPTTAPSSTSTPVSPMVAATATVGNAGPTQTTRLPGTATMTGMTNATRPVPSPTAETFPTATSVGEVLQPIIDWFTVSSGTRAEVGDPVTLSWEVRQGQQVAICYGYFQEGETNEDPFSVGSEHCTGNLPQRANGYELTLAPPDREGVIYYVTFTLQVMSGTPAGEGKLQAPIKEAMAARTVPAACVYQWFHPVATHWCPRAAATSYPGAMAQRFERGLVIYLPRRSPAPNRAIVLYDEGRTTGAMGFPVTAPPTELEVPTGLQAPAPAFYSLWARGSDNSFLQPLRDSLGWATADPIPFTYEEQCTEAPAGTPDLCYFTGPQGAVYVSDVREHTWKRP